MWLRWGKVGAEVLLVEGVEVRRWRRYGKDRLYASVGGADVGWHDLITDTAHPTRAEQLEVLTAAVRAWRSEQGLQQTGTAVVVTTEPAVPPIEQVVEPSAGSPSPSTRVVGPADVPRTALVPEDSTFEDLADRRAGAEARMQARSLKAEAPVRTMVARVLGVHTDERAWRIGADGEEKTADQLAKLVTEDPRWRVLHAVRVGDRGSDIDHVVIGPGGVFTLNSKNHPGASVWVGSDVVMVNGHRQPYVRNSRFEAARAERLLTRRCDFPVPAVGVIVIVGAEQLSVRTPPRDVHVVGRRQVVRWLAQRDECLANEQIEAVYAVARRADTWT